MLQFKIIVSYNMWVCDKVETQRMSSYVEKSLKLKNLQGCFCQNTSKFLFFFMLSKFFDGLGFSEGKDSKVKGKLLQPLKKEKFI